MSGSVVGARQANPGLTPLPDSSFGSDLGLVELPADDFGLSSGLQPLGFDGLTPLGDDQNAFGDPPGISASAGPFGSAASMSSFPNPYQSPTATVRKPTGGVSRAATIGIGEVLSSAWKIFSQNFGEGVLVQLIVVGMTLLAYVIVFGALLALGFIGYALRESPGVALALFFGFWIVFLAGAICYGARIQAGVAYWGARVVQGKSTGAGEFFRVPNSLRVIGLNFLLILIPLLFAAAGLALQYLTGSEFLATVFRLMGNLVWLIIHLLTLPAVFLIVDADHSIGSALSNSFRAMAGVNALLVFVIYLIVGLAAIPVILVTCGLGALFVAPFMYVLLAVIYAHATGRRTIA